MHLQNLDALGESVSYKTWIIVDLFKRLDIYLVNTKSKIIRKFVTQQTYLVIYRDFVQTKLKNSSLDSSHWWLGPGANPRYRPGSCDHWPTASKRVDWPRDHSCQHRVFVRCLEMLFPSWHWSPHLSRQPGVTWTWTSVGLCRTQYSVSFSEY